MQHVLYVYFLFSFACVFYANYLLTLFIHVARRGVCIMLMLIIIIVITNSIVAVVIIIILIIITIVVVIIFSIIIIRCIYFVWLFLLWIVSQLCCITLYIILYYILHYIIHDIVLYYFVYFVYSAVYTPGRGGLVWRQRRSLRPANPCWVYLREYNAGLSTALVRQYLFNY